MLLSDLRNLFRKDLASAYPEEEIDQIFYTLLEHYLDLPRFILGLEPQKFLLKEEEEPILSALARLRADEPVQYITGVAHFMGMQLEVAPDVLIPRPETEGLVRWILEDFTDKPMPARILDAGTGSGCIALSLARDMPESEVHAIDISREAISIAKKNAENQDLKVHFRHMDLCDPALLRGPFDLMVSNPPYVPASESVEMQARVKESEPELALFVPDSDPLKYYHCLLRSGLQWLSPGGSIYVETHYRLAGEVEAAFRDAGYVEIRLKKDIFGKDRYVCGSLPKNTI